MTIRIPSLLEARAQHAVEAAVQAPVELQHPGLDRVDLLARRQPVGAAGVDPGVELVEEPGDPDHEELVEVGGVDRAEPEPLEQRHPRVLGQFEDPLVEVEPGELAIEVESGIVDRPDRTPAPRAAPGPLRRPGRPLAARPRAKGPAVAGRRAARGRAPRSARRRRAAPRRRGGGAGAARRRAAGPCRRCGRGRALQSMPVWRFSISEAGPPSATATTGRPLAPASTTTCP